MNEKINSEDQDKIIFEALEHFLPTIQKLIPIDNMIGFSDGQKFLAYLPGKEVTVGDIVGQEVPPNQPVSDAYHTGEFVSNEVPKEVMGIPYKSNGVPIKNMSGKIIGAIAMGLSLKTQNTLIEAAQGIASSVQQISATTEEMASSASVLSNAVENLAEIQNNINIQVDNTDEILSLIKGIADNSKMLGINAAIEAARAGEHGRGFSVVAEEIRKMSDESIGSVKRIKNILDTIKQNLTSMTEKIMDTSKISQNVAAVSEEISATIQEFSGVVLQIEEISRII